jgi:cellulose synthase/poly-beta-1,6-N-acetylglucosamine synthase-like glycosyltransferase
MPFWINFLGQPPMLANKSPVFFVYPIVQTLFVFFFIGITQILSLREKETWRKKLLKDYVLLSLIFFNLIFIHVLSSLILLAHQIGEGINRTYFFMIFIVILILIPYYRTRAKLLAQEQKNGP